MQQQHQGSNTAVPDASASSTHLQHPGVHRHGSWRAANADAQPWEVLGALQVSCAGGGNRNSRVIAAQTTTARRASNAAKLANEQHSRSLSRIHTTRRPLPAMLFMLHTKNRALTPTHTPPGGPYRQCSSCRCARRARPWRAGALLRCPGPGRRKPPAHAQLGSADRASAKQRQDK